MFDKWRLIPVVADPDDADPLIVGLIETRSSHQGMSSPMMIAFGGASRCRMNQSSTASCSRERLAWITSETKGMPVAWLNLSGSSA